MTRSETLYTVLKSEKSPMAKGYLVLEDGTVFEGETFGAECETDGEVVFTTGMCGYQESLTDPSFRGQILVMTYPLIGNYGVAEEYYQSKAIHTRGLVVREYCKEPSPMYGGRTIDDFLKFYGIPGISGIDTRELVIKIRTGGTVKGAITTDAEGLEETIRRLQRMPAPSGTTRSHSPRMRRSSPSFWAIMSISALAVAMKWGRPLSTMDAQRATVSSMVTAAISTSSTS